MKLAVVGSRTFNDYGLLEDILDEQYDIHEGNFTLISGGALGADRLAEDYAKLHDVPIEVIKPDYDEYKNNPKVAPLIRNKEIAEKCDQMLAFWDGSSRGTANAIVEAVRLGKFVMIQGVKNG